MPRERNVQISETGPRSRIFRTVRPRAVGLWLLKVRRIEESGDGRILAFRITAGEEDRQIQQTVAQLSGGRHATRARHDEIENGESRCFLIAELQCLFAIRRGKDAVAKTHQ